jgi:hypothetical protein
MPQARSWSWAGLQSTSTVVANAGRRQGASALAALRSHGRLQRPLVHSSFPFPEFSASKFSKIPDFCWHQDPTAPTEAGRPPGFFSPRASVGRVYVFWGSVAERRRELQTEAPLTSQGRASWPSSTGPAQPCVPVCSTLQPIGSVRVSFLPFDQVLRQPDLFWHSL